MSGSRWRRSLLMMALGLVVGAGLVMTEGGAAHAHSGLQDTSPAASSVLDTAPEEIRLDFGAPVEAGLASIELFDQRASKVSLGRPQRDPSDDSVITVSVPPIGQGTYAVAWRVISADGHPMDGAFTFQVGVDQPDGPVDVNDLLARVLAGRSADPAVGWMLGLSRWLGLLGAAVLVGGGALLAASGTPVGRADTVRRLLWAGWTWVLVGSLGVLVLQGPHLTRRSLGGTTDIGLWGDVLGTRTGRAIEVRWALLIMAGYLITTLSRSMARWWRTAGALTGIGMALTFSVPGHPGSGARPAVGVPIDAAHLLAAAVWVGGLAMLAGAGRGWVERDGASLAVRRFSRWAVVAMSLLVLTGVAQTVRLADRVDGLTDTTWGRVLLVKVTLVLLAVAVGAAAHWLLRTDGPSAIGRLVVVELVLGVSIVSLAAALVALPPQGSAEVSPFATTVVQDDVLLEIAVTPARPGLNELHLVFVPTGGSLQQVRNARAELSLPGRDAPAIPIELAFAGPNHWSSPVRIPYAGDWSLLVDVDDAAGTTRSFVLTVPIES